MHKKNLIAPAAVRKKEESVIKAAPSMDEYMTGLSSSYYILASLILDVDCMFYKDYEFSEL